MKIIHQNGYSQEDLLMYKTTIYKNLLDCAKSIVSALEQFGYTFEENEETAPEALPESTDNDATTETSSNTAAASSNTVATSSNTVVTTTAPVDATKEDKITPADLEFVSFSIISPDPDTLFDPKLAAIITKLWANPIVKKIFTEKHSHCIFYFSFTHVKYGILGKSITHDILTHKHRTPHTHALIITVSFLYLIDQTA